MTNGEQAKRRRAEVLRGLVITGVLLCAATPAAQASVPTVPGVPLPTGVFEEPTMPETGGTAPPTPTTVAPAPPPTASPAPPPTARPASRRSQPRQPSAPSKPKATATTAVVEPAVAAGEEQAVPLVDAETGGAVPTARELGFPLALAALVSAFVAVQGRLDHRDPKLAAAPISVDDDLLPFA